MRPYERRVEQHPDRHEEQHAEQIAQRDHVAERLMGVLRLVDHQPRDERAERERQAEREGGVADAERDVVVASRNSSREFHRATAAINRGTTRRGDQNRDAEQQRMRRTVAISIRVAPPAGLLNSGSTIISGTTARSCTTSMPSITRLDSVPSRPCACIVFSATIVLDSEMSAPNHDRRLPGPAQAPRQAEAERDGQDDLHRRARHRDRSDRRELAERHLEPERKQQQRHAELGQLFDALDVCRR